MQAAVVPNVKARWEVEDVPTSDPGPNQVLIKIHASGLCELTTELPKAKCASGR